MANRICFLGSLLEPFFNYFPPKSLTKKTLKNDPLLEARFYRFFEICTFFFNTHFKEFVTSPVLLEKAPTLTEHRQEQQKSRSRPCIADPNSGKCNQKSSLGNTDLRNTPKFNFWSTLDPQKAQFFRSGPVKVMSGQVRSEKSKWGEFPPTWTQIPGEVPRILRWVLRGPGSLRCRKLGITRERFGGSF